MNFAIFRVGEKKYKTIGEIKGYERHMERSQLTLNSDTSIKNVRLIGSSNIVKDVEAYIEGVKRRSNTVLARDLLMTASPEFMEKASAELKQQWIQVNVDWLKKEFGNNIVYCVAHFDEKTLHLSALLVPVHETSKGKSLSNRIYFNGAAALSEWQDKYSAAMKQFGLERGIKWSKASHTTMKTFYALINKELNEQDIKSLCAKAKNSELLEIKVKALNKTLNTYKGYNQKTTQEKKDIKKQNIVLYEEIKELKENKEVFKDVIRILSDAYKIPKLHIEKVLDHVMDKTAEKDTGQERKLSK